MVSIREILRGLDLLHGSLQHLSESSKALQSLGICQQRKESAGSNSPYVNATSSLTPTPTFAVAICFITAYFRSLVGGAVIGRIGRQPRTSGLLGRVSQFRSRLAHLAHVEALAILVDADCS